MRIYEYIASWLIGTPFREPAEALRELSRLPFWLRSPESREIILGGKRSRMLLRHTISPGMNCIDVGCHLGSVLDDIVRLAPAGEHIAVEPVPYKAAWLKRKFPSVEVHQIAIGGAEAIVDFFYVPRRSATSGLKSGGSGTTTISVNCRRLDDIVPPSRHIGFIKIDVEGGEYDVFRGARRILATSRPTILFECTRTGLDAFGHSVSQVFSLLTEDHDYRIFLLKDRLSGGPPLGLAEFESLMVFPFKAFTFVAAPLPINSPTDTP